eukprot:3918495-Rhodomonas_salina.1
MPDLSGCTYYKCHCCLRAKAQRKAHPKEAKRLAKEKLGRVHMDFSGPFRVESIGGACYILVLVDNATRKVWVYLTRNRSGQA